ncbi:MAG: hypothetical protein R6V40_03475, partial [Candidatus Moraniibacteriota bacterium]
GYAWHENIGWIDFNPSGPYPSSPNHSARRESNSDILTGWARVVGIQQELAVGNSGGWEGWIKLEDVDLSDLDNSYAWNGENSDGGLGWISFEKLVLPGVPQFQACPETPPALKVALSDEVAKEGENDSTVNIDAWYAETFLKYDDCTDVLNIPIVDNFDDSNGRKLVDEDSSWSFNKTTPNKSPGLDGSDLLEKTGSGADRQIKSTGLADVEKGTIVDVEIDYTSPSTGDDLEDAVEVCIYDCSCEDSDYFEDSDMCDCGCGIEIEAKRAHGEGWKED